MVDPTPTTAAVGSTQQTSRTTSDQALLTQPMDFAKSLLSDLAEPARLFAPLDVLHEARSQLVLRLQDELIDQPEASALLGQLENLFLDATERAHTMGMEFGVAAESLRQSLQKAAMTGNDSMDR